MFISEREIKRNMGAINKNGSVVKEKKMTKSTTQKQKGKKTLPR